MQIALALWFSTADDNKIIGPRYLLIACYYYSHYQLFVKATFDNNPPPLLHRKPIIVNECYVVVADESNLLSHWKIGNNHPRRYVRQ